MATPSTLISQPMIDASTGAVYIPTGVSIAAGGETITAGGLSITAGGANVTGGLTTDILQGGVSTIATIADSGTIAITKRVAKVTGSAGATVAAAAIATSGAVAGQELIVVNENATSGSTVVISTNVIVGDGTASITIKAKGAARLIYDDTQGKWINV